MTGVLLNKYLGLNQDEPSVRMNISKSAKNNNNLFRFEKNKLICNVCGSIFITLQDAISHFQTEDCKFSKIRMDNPTPIKGESKPNNNSEETDNESEDDFPSNHDNYHEEDNNHVTKFDPNPTVENIKPESLKVEPEVKDIKMAVDDDLDDVKEEALSTPSQSDVEMPEDDDIQQTSFLDNDDDFVPAADENGDVGGFQEDESGEDISKMLMNIEPNIKTDTDAFEEEKKPKVIDITPKLEANPVAENSNAFVCPHEGCGYSAKYQTMVRRHIKHVHELIRFNCAFCDLTGIGEAGLRKHCQRKHPEMPWNKSDHSKCDPSLAKETPTFFCKIENCGFVAPNIWSLKSHKESAHPGKVMAEKVMKEQYIKTEEDFVCTFCAYKCNQLGTMRMHIKRTHGEKTCIQCDYKTNDNDDLKLHVVEVHGGAETKCDFCDKTYISQESLKEHQLYAHEDKVNPDAVVHYCDKCTYSCVGKKRFRRHQKSHMDLNCAICGKHFETMEGLQKHDRNEHPLEHNPDAELLSCDQCDFSCYSRDRLKAHKENVHKEDCKYQCHECDYKTPRRPALLLHINSKHLGVKNARPKYARCKICRIRCNSHKLLAKHVEEVHNTTLEEFYCDLCDFKSTYKSSVHIHKKMKHGPVILTTLSKSLHHPCEYCDYVSKTKASLQVHINTKHLGIKYTCETCGHQCSSQQMLTWHVVGKHGEGYPCDQCDYRATQPNQLKLHKKAIHEKERYYCQDCTFSTSFQTNLYAHIKKVHNN